jgi:tetratricopeptide (TPR) repeat protein
LQLWQSPFSHLSSRSKSPNWLRVSSGAKICVLADQLPQRHKNLFASLSREQFEQAVKRLNERIPTLNPQQIFVEMQRIVAQAKDGHTQIARRDLQGGFIPRRYPLTLFLYRDGLFVQSAAPEYARAVGGRVVKIGNATAEQALRAVREVISADNEMNLKQRLVRWLMMADTLYGLGLIEDMEKARFVVEQKGEQIAVDLKPVSYDATWQVVDARDSTAPPPLWLKDPQNNYWFEYLADSKTVYVQYNAVAEKKDETIAAFAKRLFAFVEANPVDRFVLDIRRNGGGNGQLNLPFIHGLIRSDKVNQPGKLFVLIGRGTFSAATQLVGNLEEHTPQAIFIGEPTGGKPNHYGLSGLSGPTSFRLPHSRLVVEYSNEFMQRGVPGDDSPWKAPLIAAELTSEDYRANRDPMMEAALNYQPRPLLMDSMLEIFLRQGKEAALKHYREFKADPMNAYVNRVFQLRLVGRRLMNVHQRFADAIEIFKFNVAEHPQSAEAIFLLGDGYERAGDTKAAIEAFEQALALHPKNWELADRLKALREKQQPR